MSYTAYGLSLSSGQKQKLATAFRKRAPTSVRLSKTQLSGPDKVLLTKRQITRIEKAKRAGTGVEIDFSTTQMRQQQGGFLGALLPALTRIGAAALPYLSKAAAPLATGALSGLASWGAQRVLPKSGSGLFSVPQDKVDKLITYKKYLTKKQKEQIVNALQTGSGIARFRLTPKQQGGFLGTVLASIGVPLLLKALSGKGGLQVDPSPLSSTRNTYVPQQGKGKKKKGKGLILGKNSPFKGIPLLGDIL